MSRITKALLIAAIAVMLVGATSAYGYYEAWNGWFNSGYLTFLGGDTFDYSYGEGILDDTTAGSVDSFLVTTVTPGTFTCATSGYYEGWTIKLWPGASGYKYTVQRGQKPAYDGAWSGTAILYDPYSEPVDTFTVWGTWNTSEGDDCFNYWGTPHIYSAHWVLGGNNLPGLTEGEGGSEGERIYFEE